MKLHIIRNDQHLDGIVTSVDGAEMKDVKKITISIDRDLRPYTIGGCQGYVPGAPVASAVIELALPDIDIVCDGKLETVLADGKRYRLVEL